MTWRIVHVCQSEKMQLKLDNLLIKKMGEDYIIPLSDISIIVAEGGDTVVTLRLLSALSKYNIALIVCDNEHLPTGIYHSQMAILEPIKSYRNNCCGRRSKRINYGK